MDHMMSQYLLAKADLTHTPIDGSFELTPLCNMRCQMCYVRLDSPDVKGGGGLQSVETWMSIAKEAFDAGTLFLLLTGGEPLLHPGFEEIYTRLMEMGFYVSINTNGTLINDHYVELFRKYPPRRVNITLYGFSEETYKTLCDYGPGFEKTIHAIEMLDDAGINICIHITTTQLNLQDIPSMIEFARKRDIPVEASSYVFPASRCERPFAYRLEPSVAAKTSILYERLNLADPEEGMCPEIYQTLKNQEVNPETAREMRCRAGQSSFWITWSGQMMACGMLPVPVISLKNHSFKEAWELLRTERGKIRLPAACGTCGNRNVCQVCPAKAYAESKNLEEKPEYLCLITEAMNQIMK